MHWICRMTMDVAIYKEVNPDLRYMTDQQAMYHYFYSGRYEIRPYTKSIEPAVL